MGKFISYMLFLEKTLMIRKTTKAEKFPFLIFSLPATEVGGSALNTQA